MRWPLSGFAAERSRFALERSGKAAKGHRRARIAALVRKAQALLGTLLKVIGVRKEHARVFIRHRQNDSTAYWHGDPPVPLFDKVGGRG
jgi:hypothetical protein